MSGTAAAETLISIASGTSPNRRRSIRIIISAFCRMAQRSALLKTQFTAQFKTQRLALRKSLGVFLRHVGISDRRHNLVLLPWNHTTQHRP